MSNEICIAELNSSRICHAWAALIGAIERFSGSVEQLEHLLMTQNLISGVTAG